MRVIFGILIGLVICNANLGAQERYKKAYNEYMEGDLKNSVELFKECIRYGEDTLHAYLYQAAANIFLGNYEEAMTGLDKVNQINDTLFKLQFYYGKLYADMGKLDKSIESYTAELIRHPDHAASYGERGAIKGLTGDMDGALTDLSKAIEIDPSDPEAYSNRGYTFLKARRYDEAMKDLNASLKIDPTQKAYTNRGMVYFLIDSNMQAISDYTNALKLVPDDGETMYLRGVSYKKIQMLDKACADFKGSLALGYKGAKEMLDELLCK